MAYTVSRPGQVNGAGSATALFLKVFTGEVITAFERKAVTLDKQLVKTIDSGISATFPQLGRSTSLNYHTPGTDINATVVNANEKIINIDGLMYDAKYVAKIDELENHFDARSYYVNVMAENLAMQFDQNVMSEVVLGARASAMVTGLENGTVVSDLNLTSATPATKFTAWKAAILAAAAKLDNAYAGQERYLAVTPDMYYFLMTNAESNGFSFVNKFFGGEGSVASGSMANALGFTIVSAPNLPVTDLTAKAFHGVNAAKTQAIAWVPSAVGTVKVQDISTEINWIPEKLSTLILTSCAMGHGYLMPGGCIEFVIP